MILLLSDHSYNSRHRVGIGVTEIGVWNRLLPTVNLHVTVLMDSRMGRCRGRHDTAADFRAAVRANSITARQPLHNHTIAACSKEETAKHGLFPLRMAAMYDDASYYALIPSAKARKDQSDTSNHKRRISLLKQPSVSSELIIRAQSY